MAVSESLSTEHEDAAPSRAASSRFGLVARVFSYNHRQTSRLALERDSAYMPAETKTALPTMDDFAAMNAVYAKYFPEPFPARSTVAVAGLPKGARVEIEVTAAKA